MNRDTISEYYYLALKDLEEGISIQELEEVLLMYEEGEFYEQCAGIKKAIDKARNETIVNIKKIIDDSRTD